MKQVQYGPSRSASPGRGWPRAAVGPRLLRASRCELDDWRLAPSWTLGRLVVSLLSAVWFLVALPFRLVFGTIGWLGRLTGVVVGFLLMVTGMFLLAGPLFIIGIPLFIIGLVLTLRCLD
jgi:hypothetical protein